MTQPSYDLAQEQELFGEWVLLRKWGGRRTGKGGQREILCADLEEGHRLMQDVLKRRRRRGYVLLGDFGFG
jgi:hypothetical protein